MLRQVPAVDGTPIFMFFVIFLFAIVTFFVVAWTWAMIGFVQALFVWGLLLSVLVLILVIRSADDASTNIRGDLIARGGHSIKGQH
jgi:hypothetical protein